MKKYLALSLSLMVTTLCYASNEPTGIKAGYKPTTVNSSFQNKNTIIEKKSFYESLEEFALTKEAEFFTGGMDKEANLKAAKGIEFDVKSFINIPRTEYELQPSAKNKSQSGESNYSGLISFYRSRGDTEAIRHFLAIGITEGPKVNPKSYVSLGISYLYGMYGIQKNTNKARLLLAYAASNGVHYGRYLISNDYLFQNVNASKEDLKTILKLMDRTPWFYEYQTLINKTTFRLNNYEGYYLKISCFANTKSKTLVNIKECIRPEFVQLEWENEKGKKENYALTNSSPAWINYDGESILYAPEHFTLNIRNGDKNTLLKVELYANNSAEPKQVFEAESYQNISISL
ncbi:hypothetical protein [Serratia oryzae]|uniref:Uncharacterized protein n=1 Tax=Serratia oryzae TaxID=2034155 RepID=A0A1S8CMQ6_9GAMM|nr:hypothetical protein [Serratia oryzae]OMQ24734.1 hypothetical protein BMI79_07890 [Serratia oryzae]